MFLGRRLRCGLMIKIIRLSKTQESQLERNPALCVIVCEAWKTNQMRLPSFLRGVSCIDRGDGGNKQLLEELRFLEVIARLKNE